MGLWSSGSRHSSRKSRLDRESTVSSRRRERRVDGDEVEVVQPDKAELRRRRESYYSDPAAGRKRASVSAASKTASRRPSSTTLRSSDEASRRRRRRHSTGSTKPERRPRESKLSESEKRTEEYVYGPRISQERRRDVEDRARDDYEEVLSAHRRSRNSTSVRRQSLPTVAESEVTPDDSISQVAERVAERVPDRAPDRAPSVKYRQGAFVRPSRKRSSTTSSRLPPVAEAPTDVPSNAPSRRSSRNEYMSHQASLRRHSTTSIPVKPQLVDCLTCGSDDIPLNKSAELPCKHRMCHDCLKRIFELSVKDPQHMPPKCCTDDYINPKHVDKIFDQRFKEMWNRKYHEFTTRNRIYCPTLKCGEWIRPCYVRMEKGRKIANCPRCKTKVCTLCNNKMHKSTECPKDPEIAKLVEQAKAEGWQRCYSCSAFVERKEGCNHMTCRCTAEFCILCGSKWKTCECPWFNYQHLPDPDRLNNMRVPEPIRFIYQQVFGAANGQPPPMGVGDVAQAPGVPRGENARRGPPPEVTYQQELDERRRQERLDADIARRMQLASLLNPDEDNHGRRNRNAEPIGLGNVAGHFLNDNFVQNAANVIMDAVGNGEFGRRGERQSNRRRRARESRRNDDDPGLAPNFLGDESVLGGEAHRYR